ncbi:MAG: glycerol-3-phosphate acyltransferase [Bdellovibrionota bacterium]
MNLKQRIKNLHRLPYYSRKQVMEDILSQPSWKKFLSIHAKTQKDQHRIEKKATSILKNMMAEFSPRFLRYAYWVVHWAQKSMFEHLYVREEEIQQTLACVTRHPVIFLPTHKSHMDYLLLSYVLFNHNICPPHIAAGINLSFWPIGSLMKKSGAFFIRRKLSRDKIYVKILDLYLSWLVGKQYTQELFIEGGRSRDGAIRSAFLGIMHLLIEAKPDDQDMYFIPVQINYDEVPDEKSLTQERLGKVKKAESLMDLLNLKKIFQKKYGNIYMRFGEPIQVGSSSPKEEAKRISNQTLSFFRKHHYPVAMGMIGHILCAGPKDRTELNHALMQWSHQLRTYNVFGIDLVQKCQDKIDLLVKQKKIWIDSNQMLQISESAQPTFEYYAKGLEEMLNANGVAYKISTPKPD